MSLMQIALQKNQTKVEAGEWQAMTEEQEQKVASEKVVKKLKQGIDLDCSNHFILNIFHASKVLLTISLTSFPIH